VPVHERLYQPDARARYLEVQERKRREAEALEEEECTFQPAVNRPSRVNPAVSEVGPSLSKHIYSVRFVFLQSRGSQIP